MAARRKGNIPKRKGKQKEMKSDEKLVEKEVKKYLLKIPSLKANYAVFSELFAEFSDWIFNISLFWYPIEIFTFS
jgi:hypothetical protein